MAHTATAALSDTTSVTSPTPFSPFSSAYSVSSDATVVSEGQADLGAFQSVFFALSQLQLNHQHHPRSPRNDSPNTTTPSGNTPPTIHRHNDDSTDDDEDDDIDDNEDDNDIDDAGFATTPSLFPVSPLNLDGTVSRSSIHPSTAPPSRAQRTRASDQGSITDDAVASDIILAAAGASSEEGDEESLAMTSPNSQPSTGESDDYIAAGMTTFPDGQGRRWMFAESPYDPSFRPSASSEDSEGSQRQQDESPVPGGMNADDNTGTSPSLGDMEAAFAFFAAERAKLVKQLEASKTGTPTTMAPTLPTNNRKNNKRGGKGHRKNKSSEPLAALPDSDEASQDASPSATGAAAGLLTLSSSSPDDQIPDMRRRNQRLGGSNNSRQPKQQPNNKSAVRPGLTPSSTFPALPTNSQSTLLPAVTIKQPRIRAAHLQHRHSRSLPIDPSTVASIHQQLAPYSSPLANFSTSAKSDEADRIRDFAKKLTFQFPFDTPYLRKVMQNPQGVMGLRSHATPVGSDDQLVADGFFDPVYSPGMGGGLGVGNSALLYVFIDHSNILVGFLEWLKRQGITNKQLNGKPKLSHSALALLIERGRRCLRKVLVASSPLYQSLDEMAGMGYQISVLQRVEIKEGSSTSNTPQRGGRRSGMGHSRSSSFNSITPNRKGNNGGANGKGGRNASPQKPKSGNNNNNNNAGSSTESDSNSQQKRNNNGGPSTQAGMQSFAARLVNNRRGGHHRRNSSTDVASFITPSNSSTSLAQIREGGVGTPTTGPSTPSSTTNNNSARPRFREEAVDELLQLKLLQTLLDEPSPPPLGSTIVLASGDAARSQFNPQGFLGCVRKAVDRGWNVEVVGWDEGRSRAYAELANEVSVMRSLNGGVGGMMSIISLDKWGMDLLENRPT